MTAPVLGSTHDPRRAGKAIAAGSTAHPQTVIRKRGNVVSVQAGPPQTLTITIGADPTQIPGIRFRASYAAGVAPVAGDAIEIDAVGSYLVVVDKLAT